MKYGLLGRKLSHSYSKQIHSLLCDYDYSLIETEPSMLGEFLTQGDFDGLNVTVPYKIEAAKYCDVLSQQALKTGCVNTIVQKNGLLYGYNTDCFGFSYMLQHSGIQVTNKKILIAGNGGAARAVDAVLDDCRTAQRITLSRSGENNFSEIVRHYDAQIIINATPVGMYPDNGGLLFELDYFRSCEGVLDLIYNPFYTRLLLCAKKANIKHANGLTMLAAQAKRSAELFTGNVIDDGIIGKITTMLAADMTNIILIGMPSSGKTSIGKAVARKMNRRFIDIDEQIEAKQGRRCADIIRQNGEQYFRTLEKSAIEQFCALSGAVIATGGGCVCDKNNYPLLKQNGIIIYLKRDLDKLCSTNRPLSLENGVTALYNKRREMYEAFADISIDGNYGVEKTADDLISAYNGYFELSRL